MFKLYKGFFKINMSAVFVEAVIRTEEFWFSSVNITTVRAEKLFLLCQSGHQDTKALF